MAGALLPGVRERSLTLTRSMADKILKAACERANVGEVEAAHSLETSPVQGSSLQWVSA